jgi:hypothetical protein
VIRRFAFRDPDAPRPDRFAAIDPGDDGATAIFERGNRDPIRVLDTANDFGTIAMGLSEMGVSVLVLESQYIGANASSALDIVTSAWTLVGFLACYLRGVDVVDANPATWQAMQRRRMGVAGKLKRKEGIAIAKDEAGALCEAYAPKRAEGVASAIGIGRGYLELYP